MTTIKKYKCPSCGGDLTVDNDKQMYCCTSCGSTYDFDYFREEKLNEMGETHLSRKEFAAAVDAYRLLLKSNPHDFAALRGLMLAAAYLKDMDGLVRVGEAKHFSYNSKLVKEVTANASAEDKDYFTEFGKIYADKKTLIDCNRELESQRRARDRLEAEIRLTEDSRYDYYFHGKGGTETHPMAGFIAVWCMAALFIMMTIGIASPLAERSIGGMLLAIFIFGGMTILTACVVNFGYVYPRIKAIKEIDSYIKEYKVELGYTEAQIRKYEAAAEELSGTIRNNIKVFVDKDSLRKTDPATAKVQVSEVSTIRKHQCPSCGGSLTIDSDKQMYHCTFCGSSYDYEYFKEDSIHEAGETYLSRGEFMATADAYEFMLKKDPHDFLALRGLMLAAARLSSMSELDQEVEDEEFSYDPEMVSQAIDSAAEEDKEYFRELARVYSEKKKLVDITGEIEALWERKREINDVIAHNNISRKDYYIASAHPIIQFLIGWVGFLFCFLWVLILTVLLAESFFTDPDSVGSLTGFVIGEIVFLLGVAGCNFLFIYPKVRKIKKLDRENSDLYVESGKVEEKIKYLENESSECLSGLKRSIHEFVRKDRLRMNGKDL